MRCVCVAGGVRQSKAVASDQPIHSPTHFCVTMMACLGG